MRQTLEVHGFCKEGWEPVQHAFEDNFTQRFERGGSVSIVFKGDTVVDLWAGVTDENTQQPWQEDTLSLVFSTTKGMAALCCAIAHAEGLLDYDMPVAEVWPEFAQNGKGGITIRELLEHQGGLPIVPKVGFDDLEDFDRLAESIAPVAPLWEPGSAVGYHVYTQGMYVGEVLRRLVGKPINDYFHEKVRDRLGIEYHMGLPDEHIPRTARIHMPRTSAILERVPKYLLKVPFDDEVGTELPFLLRSQFPWTRAYKAMQCVPPLSPGDVDNFNHPRARKLCLPSAIGFTNARELARLYGQLAGSGVVEGQRLIDDDIWQRIQTEQASSRDQVLFQTNAFSFGFARASVVNTFGTGERTFGFGGAGGSVGFADPDHQLGFGYAMNTMWFRFADPRFMALRNAAMTTAASMLKV